MDAIDLKILALLQNDATLSIAQIGERVGLSQTPCWKRIQRLEADGVIDRRVAVLDPVKLGLGLTVFVSIETSDHSREWLERFAATVAGMPEVLEFYRMAGTWITCCASWWRTCRPTTPSTSASSRGCR